MAASLTFPSALSIAPFTGLCLSAICSFHRADCCSSADLRAMTVRLFAEASFVETSVDRFISANLKSALIFKFCYFVKHFRSQLHSHRVKLLYYNSFNMRIKFDSAQLKKLSK
jgi:uncharacterized BrkB/YihY/UPF0761 family membrane protein